MKNRLVTTTSGGKVLSSSFWVQRYFVDLWCQNKARRGHNTAPYIRPILSITITYSITHTRIMSNNTPPSKPKAQIECITIVDTPGGGDGGGTGGGGGGGTGGYCLRCGELYNKCARHKHGQALTTFAANNLAAHPTLPNNKKRRRLYRYLQVVIMGRPEDYANDVAVPHCIRDKAREMYPDSSNEYLVKDGMDHVPVYHDVE